MFGSLNLQVYAQNNTKGNIPQEKVYLHFNKTLFVTGENLYYKLYCLNDETNQLSTISKIAYVELISTKNESIFSHKLKLENGVGNGDFFITTNIPSGNYKLVAYTQWMKNGTNNFYQNDITIVNPFQNDQSGMLAKNDSIYQANHIFNLPVISSKYSDNQSDIKLNTNKEDYNKREKVTINIEKINSENISGNYSISIHKVDSVVSPTMLPSTKFNTLFTNSNTNSTEFIPEIRGEIISGKVLDSLNNPIANCKVGISIPGKNYIFKIATTNNLGKYYFNLNKSYENKQAVVQVIDKQREKLTVIVDSFSKLNTSNLQFSEFKITPAIKKLILDRSIQNQIENAYANVKLNTVDSIYSIDPFYKTKATSYKLDDFTRFPTIKETVVEILETVYVRQRKEGNTLHVRIYDDKLESGLLPMLLIDGVLIQNHEEFLDYNPNNIEKIDVVGAQYIYGSQLYDGIIAAQTKSGNYDTRASGNFIKKIELFKPLAKKHYFLQVYQDSKFDRIPDYRSQLLWMPNVQFNKTSKKIDFYTSDISGLFEINLEGFNEKGKPTSIKKYIKVN